MTKKDKYDIKIVVHNLRYCHNNTKNRVTKYNVFTYPMIKFFKFKK